MRQGNKKGNVGALAPSLLSGEGQYTHPMMNRRHSAGIACCPLTGILLVVMFFGVASLPAAEETIKPMMVELAPGVFQVGKLRLDKNKHTVTFPATVNQVEGALEYVLVTKAGAVHESLLTTEIEPNDLHFAMLLLGAKGAGLTTPEEKDAAPAQINADYLKTAPQLKGDSVNISAQWTQAGKEVITPVEDWLFNEETKKTASRGAWIYTGSMFNQGHFMAQIDGCFVALVTNPAALINNPRQGSNNDQIWNVNKKAIPARDTALQLILQLEPAGQPKPTK